MKEKQHVINFKSFTPPITYTNSRSFSVFLREHLYSLLISLEGIQQNSHYHPEGDVLYHSLQVFQQAHQTCDDPELWATALLHDIGKAVSVQNHAQIGANELEGLLSSRIVWLIRHHLHLLIAPKRTRYWLRNTAQLYELELLRSWDVKGRSPHATVMTPDEAINTLMMHFPVLSSRNIATYYYENREI